jgi:hypothetical protein
MGVLQEVETAVFFDDAFPGPLTVWQFAGIMMAVAAIVIAVIVYYMPAPPQIESPRHRRNPDLISPRRSNPADSHRQHSRASVGSRKHSSESRLESETARRGESGRVSGKLRRHSSRSDRSVSPTFGETSGTRQRSPTLRDAEGSSRRPLKESTASPRDMKGIPERVHSPVESNTGTE